MYLVKYPEDTFFRYMTQMLIILKQLVLTTFTEVGVLSIKLNVNSFLLTERVVFQAPFKSNDSVSGIIKDNHMA